MNIAIVLSFTLFVISGSHPVGVDLPSTRRGEVLDQYKRSLTSIADFYTHSRVSGLVVDHYKGAKNYDVTYSTYVDFMRNKDNRLLKMYKVDKEGAPDPTSEIVFGQNVQGFFLLKHAPDSSRYVVSNLGTKLTFPLDMQILANSRHADCAFSLCGLSLAECFGSNHIDVNKITEYQHLGKRFLQFYFVYRPSDAPPRRIEGWWTVTPDEGWGVEEYEYHVNRTDKVSNGSGNVTKGSVLYGQLIDGIPVPTSTEIHFSQTGGYQQNHRFEIKNIVRSDESDSAFAPSAFGLGALDKPPRRNYSVSFWFFAVAVSCFIGTLLTKLISKWRLSSPRVETKQRI